MSTRSAIARPTADGFAGRYHHWDGYPTGLGATLFQIHTEVFNGDTERMLEVLIDEHPAGWSTINGADWSLPFNANCDLNEKLCDSCGEPNWKHYIQNYKSRDLPAPKPHEEVGPYAAFDHSFVDRDDPQGPSCSCHRADGTKWSKEDWLVTQKDASGSGVEWVYVIDAPERAMSVLSSFVTSVPGAEGKKMIGFFGCGDDKAEWRAVAVVDLDGPAPDWEAIENWGYAQDTTVAV